MNGEVMEYQAMLMIGIVVTALVWALFTIADSYHRWRMNQWLRWKNRKRMHRRQYLPGSRR